MLFLVFHVSDQRFALEARVIEEITPLVELGKIPKVAHYVAGIFHYRGSMIPVIDLCQLLEDRPSVAKVSTRIIVIRFTDKRGKSHLLGLIAEGVNDTFCTNLENFMGHDIEIAEAPALGRVMYDDSGMIQLVDTQQLLNEQAASLVFTRDTVENSLPAETSCR